MKTALVFGAGGFIGSHMVKRLKSEGYWVLGVDLKYPDFSISVADEFLISDLRVPFNVQDIICNNVLFDEIYQFAADMGGAGYIFTGDHDADIMSNSVAINLNLLNSVCNLNQKYKLNKTKIFYSSSACIYPKHNQLDPHNPNCSESSAYPANPDSEYGWEKLFSERLYLAYSRNYGIQVRIARFHNIFGPEGVWTGGKEKAPAAICRKVIEVESEGSIDVWGDGEQTRSFLYIDNCIDAVRCLMISDFQGPINIGSEEMVTINQLVEIVALIANKIVRINHVNGPEGVRGRCSDNTLIRKKLGWDCNMTLVDGISKTYFWINDQYGIRK